MVRTYVIDLFAGAGGTSTAIFESKTNIEVIWCVNHDSTALRSHEANYPNCIHSTEDIRTFDLRPLIMEVKRLRRIDPTCKIAIWASLECTNFSKAKCGPKDADSRTLAEDMFRYLDGVDPDFFWVENVEEFRDWGPLDSCGNPVGIMKGVSYDSWIKTLGREYFQPLYFDENLISADYGGVTIRKRLFLQFAKDVYDIGNPTQTHSKCGVTHRKWRPVKEVLDLDNIGKSIFTRKRPFVESTHRRIYKGLNKFGPKQGTNFGIKYYGQDGHQDIEQPSATLTTKDRISLVHLKADGFMHNPQYGGSNRSFDNPSATLIARQDKAPMGITMYQYGSKIPEIEASDDKYMKEIKDFCKKHGISDILVRPLTVDEMLKIQGFPDWYTLTGTQTEQKKHIGNSVEVKVGIALFRSIDKRIQINAA
jgi:DNA (cytosine-5)-methyltransferase 1